MSAAGVVGGRRRRGSAALGAFAALLVAIVAIVVATSAGCAALLGTRPLDAARPGATTYHTIDVGGQSRHFLLHLPPAAAHGRVPLVLAFHGHGGSGAVLRASSRLDEAADAVGVAVAYPDGSGRVPAVGLSWNAGTCCGWAHERGIDELAFADTLVAALRRRLPIDSTRVFAAGFSAGGMLALRLACDRAATFAAVVDVAGAMPDTACAPGRPVSVLLVQGAEDDELRFDLRTLRRTRGSHRFAHSLEQALLWWARHDGCRPPAGLAAVVRDSTADRVHERATGCPPGVHVELVTIADHPHAWPGGVPTWLFAPRPAPQVDASRLSLEFLARSGGRTAVR